MLSLVQKRSVAGARAVALCPTMDLVALVTADGTLSVYRSMTWERVLQKTASEVASSGSPPSALAFSPSGKALALGHQHGEVSLLNIESGEVVQSYGSSSSGVVAVSWIHSANNGGRQQSGVVRNLVESVGMEEYFDPELGEVRDKSLLEPLFAAAEGGVLLALAEDGTLMGHVLGLSPLFSWSGKGRTQCGLLPAAQLLVSARGDVLLSADAAVQPGTLGRLRVPALLRPSDQQRATVLLLTLSADMTRLVDALLGAGRKWKDACKVVVPKLGLLEGVLAGYELGMTPVQFMFSLAHCGNWHPAAAAFAQHWNEQGLGRLRASVEVAGRAVLRLLQLRALPLATNTVLRCKELLAVLGGPADADADAAQAQGQAQSQSAEQQAFVRRLRQLSHCAELLLLKLDEAAHEARLAREAMLLYLVFIKEQSAAAEAPPPPEQGAAAPQPPPQPSKPDLSLAPKLARLFSPLATRAPHKGPQAQAEHVCASHLYAFLQDQDLPPALVAERASPRGCGFAGVLGDQRSGGGGSGGGKGGAAAAAEAAAAVRGLIAAADGFAISTLLHRDSQGENQGQGQGQGQGEGSDPLGSGAEAAAAWLARSSPVQLARAVRERARALGLQAHALGSQGLEPAVCLDVRAAGGPGGPGAGGSRGGGEARVCCSDFATAEVVSLSVGTVPAPGAMDEQRDDDEEQQGGGSVRLTGAVLAGLAYHSAAQGEDGGGGLLVLVGGDGGAGPWLCARVADTEPALPLGLALRLVWYCRPPPSSASSSGPAGLAQAQAQAPTEASLLVLVGPRPATASDSGSGSGSEQLAVLAKLDLADLVFFPLPAASAAAAAAAAAPSASAGTVLELAELCTVPATGPLSLQHRELPGLGLGLSQRTTAAVSAGSEAAGPDASGSAVLVAAAPSRGLVAVCDARLCLVLDVETLEEMEGAD